MVNFVGNRLDSHALLVRLYSGTAILEIFELLKMLNIHLPSHPAILLLGIYQSEMKAYAHKNTCTCMSVTALFIIAQNYKQFKCLSTAERANTTFIITTTEYYSAVKREQDTDTHVNMNEPKNSLCWGTWVVQSVRYPTLGLGSGLTSGL